jgi:pyrophosphate--fructose-6-phosphate 1-phosphotransferase
MEVFLPFFFSFPWYRSCILCIDIENFSEQQRKRLDYIPSLPPAFRQGSQTGVAVGENTAARSTTDEANLRTWFPSTYGQPIANVVSVTGSSTASSPLPSKPLSVCIVFAGRQSPGGHNVVTGLVDFLKQLAPGSKVYGATGGTIGLFEQRFIEINDKVVQTFRNQVCIEGW